MKKIVFVIESLHLGGAEKSLVTLLQNLDPAVFDIDLIVFSENGIFREFVPDYVNCIELDFPKLTNVERLHFFIKRKFVSKQHNAQLLWAIIENKFKQQIKEYDIAVSYNQGFATYFVNKYMLADKKYAWLNTDYKKAGYSILFDYPIYSNFDKIVTVSPEAKSGLKEELVKVNKNLPITIIKDITDEKIVEQQARTLKKVVFDEDYINIVSVGRLALEKGFFMAIESCKIIISKGYKIKWYVIGEGNERENLEKLIKESSLENNFFLLGADPNPYPYMKNASIYVQTSLFEGLGLTVIEASLLNKPIVSTNFPTVHGIIKDEETGLITEMKAESISKQVERLIINKELREKFSTNLEKLENRDKEITLSKIKQLFL